MLCMAQKAKSFCFQALHKRSLTLRRITAAKHPIIRIFPELLQ